MKTIDEEGLSEPCEVTPMCGESEPSYQLKVQGNLIAASFSGRWNIAIDLAFMTELGTAMQSMRGQRWGLFVDMRLWEMPNEVVNAMQRAKVDLDRRNQIAECWWVRDERQGNFIKPLLAQHQIPLISCKSEAHVRAWLESTGMSLPVGFNLS